MMEMFKAFYDNLKIARGLKEIHKRVDQLHEYVADLIDSLEDYEDMYV